MESPVIYIDIEKELITPNGKMNLVFKSEIASGELLALYGASGEGKTTLLRMLAGLTKPDKGVIKCGERVWFDSVKGIHVPPQNRNIGYMFQDYALFPNMTIAENIRFAQTIPDEAMVDQLLELFGLTGFRNQKPDRLSGGQKQRVALARALARIPDILLLDEPFSSLDYKMRISIQKEIKKAYQFKRTTMIIVSHDPAEILRLAERIICIEEGVIVRTGTPKEVFADFEIITFE